MECFCRACKNKLTYTFANLGLMPLANDYLNKEDLNKSQNYLPLNVKVCDKCFMVQALQFEAPQKIFKNYKYFSSFSKSWLKHCENYVDMIVKRLKLNDKSNVIEIASNDGYLLQFFKKYNINVLGIEPAENIAKIAQQKGIKTIIKFFEKNFAIELSKYIKADLLIGNNVLAHVPDINDFIEGIKIILSPNSTATFEFPHILNLIKFNQFDTIYHEHFSYFSLITLTKLFEKHKLKIYDVDKLITHGGSLRIYVTHKENINCKVSINVENLLKEETEFGLTDINKYIQFNKKIEEIKRNSLKELIRLKESGKKIIAYGAAAKGNTFLNYCGIGKDFIDYVVDSNTHKQNLYLPGSLLSIESLEILQKDNYDYVIILPWNLKNEIIKVVKEKSKNKNIKFITFIPEIKIE